MGGLVAMRKRPMCYFVPIKCPFIATNHPPFYEFVSDKERGKVQKIDRFAVKYDTRDLHICGWHVVIRG